MKIKKIGVLIGQIVQIGGVAVAAFEEVRNLRKLGYEAELVVLKERRDFPYQDFTQGLPIRFISRETPQLFNFSFKIPFFSFFNSFHLISPLLVPFVVKAKDYDCLIVHETYNAFTALSLKWFRKIPFYPIVWDPISYILPRVYSKRFLRLFFPVLLPLGKFLDCLIVREGVITLTGSHVHSDVLIKASRAKNVAIVYPGCYPREKIPSRRGSFIIALTKWDLGKNPRFLLEVLCQLKNKKAKLVLGGGWVQSWVKDDFLREAKNLGLEERIELLGQVSEEKKMKLFSEARVLIHPIFEAFGMFGLEAAGCGCPIIIPQGSGVTELFEHGVHGFFPKEGDIESFVKYLDLLLEDERKAWKIGKAAWEVTKKYTWEHHAERLLEVIKKNDRC